MRKLTDSNLPSPCTAKQCFEFSRNLLGGLYTFTVTHMTIARNSQEIQYMNEQIDTQADSPPQPPTPAA